MFSPSLKNTFPDKPWLWRSDWEKRSIQNEEIKQSKDHFWIGIVLIVVCGYPVSAIPSELAKRNYLILLVLLFPLVGGLFISRGILGVLRRRKFGVVTFNFSENPCSLGAELRGTVVAGRTLSPGTEVRLIIECMRKKRDRQKDTFTQIVWQNEFSVRSEVSALGSQIPVRIMIPADCTETSGIGTEDEYYWQLRCDSSSPGVSFTATFVIPVFKTDKGDESKTVNTLTSEESDKCSAPENPTVRVTRENDGLHLYFGAARNIGFGLAILIFAVITSLGAGFAAYAVASIHLVVVPIIVIPFAFVDLLLTVVVLFIFFETTEVLVKHNEIMLTKRMFAFKQSKVINGSDIRELALGTSMQSGGQVYWDIKVEPKSGKPITLGSGIANKDEAKWILSEIRDELKLR